MENQMKVIKRMLKPGKEHEILLLLVLVIYILAEVKTPHPLANILDNVYGNATVTILAIVIGLKTNILVGVVSLVAGYELVKRSSVATGTHAVRNYIPCENKKLSDFEKYNEFPVTLEEEIVAKMAPLVEKAPSSKATYKPVLHDLHEASCANN